MCLWILTIDNYTCLFILEYLYMQVVNQVVGLKSKENTNHQNDDMVYDTLIKLVSCTKIGLIFKRWVNFYNRRSFVQYDWV